ncbi:hypothetical protein M0M57_04325 [Flavobacterium azooxidireducens]|uniref:Lipoprotein n=1 Tax=Flavobacterium azooxidireducens TaxID=1871076 RepID=A0ABY4KK72_9FLAO|nr:hypothetical protein [Flavobacterium azooxidireducens]UPQ80063.1 hypothetical protein M0M57_04325 [Flavobacterium azooxidireducens]
MKIYNVILVILLTCSCSSNKRDSFSYDYKSKDFWINSYKYEVFYGCIKEGLVNDSLRIILKDKDLFNPNSDLDFLTIDNAREKGKKIIRDMPDVYIKIDSGEEKLKTKNFILFNCLNYYKSKELDSIANNAYKIFQSKQ